MSTVPYNTIIHQRHGWTDGQTDGRTDIVHRAVKTVMVCEVMLYTVSPKNIHVVT